MKRVLLTAGLLLCLAVGAGTLDHYEADLRTPTNPDVLETLQARSDAEARIMLRQRYPAGSILALRRLQRQAGYDWYAVRVSVAGVNLSDTALAKGSGDARRIFSSRFPEGHIISLNKLGRVTGYSFFESTLHGAGKKVFQDVVFAVSESAARKALEARYPGARVASIAKAKMPQP